jgi:hypothetical protein
MEHSMVRKIVLLLVMILATQGMQAQQPSSADAQHKRPLIATLRLTPGLQVPLGKDSEIYKLGVSADIAGELQLPSLPLTLNLGAGYQLSPIQADISLSVITAGPGAGLRMPLLPGLFALGHIQGGFAYSFVNEEDVAGSGWYVKGGVGAFYLLTRRLGLVLDASYNYYAGLYNGFSCNLGFSYLLAPTPGSSVNLQQISLDPVYPVFYKYYNSNPIGTATVVNDELTAIDNLRLSVYVEEYMTNPKSIVIPGRLDPGDRREIDLFGLFNERVMTISEGTIASAKIDLGYTIKGKSFNREYIESLRLHNRNAVTWDDDRKAAAFVTAKDPVVLKFAKNTISVIKESGPNPLNENFLKAISLHDAVALVGTSYVIDPSTPYKELSEQQSALDYLQFPRQTLEYRAGDCDDLSIIYCALLEATGVETAFITVPGHIFMAFCLGPVDDPSLKTFDSSEFIYRDEKAWLPVETTQIQGGFLRAWQIAAKQWREHREKGQPGFYPIHEAWEMYEPVAFSGADGTVNLPPAALLADRFAEEVSNYSKRQIASKEAHLQALLSQRPGDPKLRNRLGVLYARFGLYDEAEQEFRRAIEQETYIPALMNLGNLHYLRDDFVQALTAFQRAAAAQPSNPRILLSLAKAHHEMEDYPTAGELYRRIVAADPTFAAKYDYLDLKREDPARAAEVSRLRAGVLWEEEL